MMKLYTCYTDRSKWNFEATGDYFLGFDIKDFSPISDIDPYSYQLERKGKQNTTPYFTAIKKFA